jgi:hypothetical protein
LVFNGDYYYYYYYYYYYIVPDSFFFKLDHLLESKCCNSSQIFLLHCRVLSVIGWPVVILYTVTSCGCGVVLRDSGGGGGVVFEFSISRKMPVGDIKRCYILTCEQKILLILSVVRRTDRFPYLCLSFFFKLYLPPGLALHHSFCRVAVSHCSGHRTRQTG